MKVLILNSEDGDWEGLFIDGKLIDQGHTLGEGNAATYLLEKPEEYNFSSKNIESCCVTQEDDEYLMKFGGFPSQLSKLKGEY